MWLVEWRGGCTTSSTSSIHTGEDDPVRLRVDGWVGGCNLGWYVFGIWNGWPCGAE